IFYGEFLNIVPEIFPTPLFHGQLIYMLYFPIFYFYWPECVSFTGGVYFEFFSPVFNIADSSIFIGVASILLFQRRFFKEKETGEVTLHIEQGKVDLQATELNPIPTETTQESPSNSSPPPNG
ncbi:MAG TPA: signal peptidase II, partial [Cyclobacteriaceae bacterium]|nr:signal peptidase II [Cyclobacteriaceae bacterium]